MKAREGAWEVESELGRIWSGVLGIPAGSIDPDANFFELGGDSLLIARVADQVASQFFAANPDEAPGIGEYFSHGTLRSFASRLTPALNVAAPTKTVATSAGESAVAVIGMACRFPGAPDPETFWRNLRDGVESIRTFADDELLEAGVSSADLQNPGYVKAGVVLDGVRLFDADYFGLTPREAALTSPEQRLLVECAEEALQDAGCSDCLEAPQVGVFVGTGLSTYLLELLAGQAGNLESSQGMAFFASNTCAASRISYLLDLNGPSVTVDTACSSSLVAVHQACQSILRGECAMALAGGATVRRFAARGYVAEPGGIFSPDGHCRPFDQQAQGTVASSGAGMVLLKKLSHAIADGDTIHAVIRGTAVNNDGGAKAGYTAPSAAGQASVIRAALTAAGVEPGTISYLETHGTATALGDAIELSALSEVFSSPAGAGRPALGALKANVGHMEAAAGIGGLIKTILVLKHRQIPPAIHFRGWAAGLGKPSFSLSSRLTGFSSAGGPLRAGVSSFGIGGTNAHAVLEEAPIAPARVPARSSQLLVVSARTEPALRESCRRLASRLKSGARVHLADMAFTLQTGRKQFGVRTHVVASDVAGAARALELAEPCHAKSAPVAFMFSDEGAPYAGSAMRLYETEPPFRAALDEMDRLLQLVVGRSLLDILKMPDDGVLRSEWSRPALFAVEYSLSRLWNAWGIVPSLLFGRGTGEYVAACVSGSMTPEEALRLLFAGQGLPPRARVAEMADLLRASPAIALEVGPGRSLCDLVRVQAGAQALTVVPSLPGDEGAADERGSLLRALGRLWERGVVVDWAAVGASGSRRRVSLPGYPLERREHWALSDSPRAASMQTTPQRLEISDWFNVAVWEQRPALPRTQTMEEGCCLLVGSWSELESQICEHQALIGRRAVCVPSADPSSLRRVFETLEREGTAVSCVVHCAEAANAAAVDERPDGATLDAGLYVLLDLCKFMASLRRRPRRLIILTRGAYSIAGDEPVSPRRAMLAPAVEVIGREFPDVSCRAIDIAWAAPKGELRALIGEIFASCADSVIALRGARRWARSYRSSPLGSEGGVPLRTGGTYLITGGMGGIGWSLARFLAETYRAQLIVVGRSPFPERSTWDERLRASAPDDPMCARIREIRSLEATGARVLVVSGDVSSIEDMRRVVNLALGELGRLDGVIHAAGVARTGALHAKDRESIAAVLKPKVMGTWALYEGCKSQALDFFVCCSSIASVLAPAGWFEYSAANAFQDAFCEALDGRTATRFVSIGWDGWKEVGMAARFSGDRDGDISPTEGVEVFRRALANPSARWIVSTRPLQFALQGATVRASTQQPNAVSIPERTSAAATPVARSLATIQTDLSLIWRELLGVQSIATSDDFFSLGGDSLTVVDLHTRLEAHFGRVPSVQELLADSTLGAMAQRLQEAG